MLNEQGYEVISDWNVGKGKMLQRCKQLIQNLGGSEGSVVPFYFAGHGVEVAGMQFLVPVDATDYDPQSLVPLAEFLRLPRAAHRPGVASDFGSQPVRSALYACFLDICRLPVPEERVDAFGAAAAQFPAERRLRRQVQASSLLLLRACQAGGRAQETPDGHGYFTKALLGVQRDATLQQYADHVMQQVPRETEAARACRPSLQVQQPCLESECPHLGEVTLAQPTSWRGSSGSTVVAASSFASLTGA